MEFDKATQGHYVQDERLYDEIKTMDRNQRGCKDVAWAILFWIHLAVFGYATFRFTPAVISDATAMMDSDNYGKRLLFRRLEDATDEQDLNVDLHDILVIVTVALVIGLILSTLALGILASYAITLIQIALISNVVMFVALGLLSFFAAEPGYAFICLFMGGFMAYYCFKIWHRIPFAASNLVTAVAAVQPNLGLAAIAYWNFIVMAAWAILWTVGASATIYVVGACNPQGECQKDVPRALVFALFVSFFWTQQIISNVVHCTTAGTVGTWWFQPHEASGCCSTAVTNSYIRSLTTSFGSICFGSLVVALVQATREMIHSMRENGDSLAVCCAECIIGCIESIVEYFNRWAFVYVAIYGTSFMESGKAVITLFRDRGWTAIIADLMIDTVLSLVSFGVAILTTLLALAIGTVMGSSGDSLLVATVLGFIVGLSVCSTLFSVLGSAVNTVIVCYADAPVQFETNHPELSQRMRESWRDAWPHDFQY